MGHQNLLGLMSHFVVLPFFAILLSGRGGALTIMVIASGVFVILSTASRGTIGLEAFGLAVVFLLSCAEMDVLETTRHVVRVCGDNHHRPGSRRVVTNKVCA